MEKYYLDLKIDGYLGYQWSGFAESKEKAESMMTSLLEKKGYSDIEIVKASKRNNIGHFRINL